MNQRSRAKHIVTSLEERLLARTGIPRSVAFKTKASRRCFLTTELMDAVATILGIGFIFEVIRYGSTSNSGVDPIEVGIIVTIAVLFFVNVLVVKRFWKLTKQNLSAREQLAEIASGNV